MRYWRILAEEVAEQTQDAKLPIRQRLVFMLTRSKGYAKQANCLTSIRPPTIAFRQASVPTRAAASPGSTSK